MIESLLAKVVIGVVAGGIVGAAACGVYKYITKDSAKEEIKEKLNTEEEDIIHKAFKAKVKKRMAIQFHLTYWMKWMKRCAILIYMEMKYQMILILERK